MIPCIQKFFCARLRKEALEILKAKQKKKIRLIQTTTGSTFPYDVKIIQGLTLVQEAPDYEKKLDPSKVTVETKSQAFQEGSGNTSGTLGSSEARGIQCYSRR